jgi:transketolase|tara:strand:+ start:1889 stop:3841 length:1953 start_codon:yes stop_codon:yes gene_type:complete
MKFKKLTEFNNWTEKDKDLFTVNVIKGLVIDGVSKANSGHPGGPMSLADFTYILYSEFLTVDPGNPDWRNRDRVVLSVGHTCMLIYSILYMCNYISMKDLKEFRQMGSLTPGHPEVETPGIDANTGPLGQGVGMGVGMALAERASAGNNKSNRFTYVLAGDGDLQEPIALGSSTLAGHWKLSNLIMFYDKNDIQIAGKTSRVDSTNYAKLYESMGWHVQEIDGHNHSEIRKAIQNAQSSQIPSIIIGTTTIAKGSYSLENNPKSHGAPFSEEEIKHTKDKLGIPQEAFFCNEDILNHFQRNFNDLKKQVTILDESYENLSYNNSKMLESLSLPDFGIESMATRQAFGISLDEFAKKFPNLIGGSADLDGSNCTTNFVKNYGDFSFKNPKGRNIAFGVREFPMGAIMNGISLYGNHFPFGGTFLVFSDYVRSAIRLSAIQNLHVLYEFTHDSIFVGEDGPTHQPVEHTMSLRNIPNLLVFRPADSFETYYSFKTIMENTSNPSALLLTRQKLPKLNLEQDYIAEGVKKGAYIILKQNNPDAVLFTSGSELHLAIEVCKELDYKVQIVNVPCWELFDRQEQSYIDSIMIKKCNKRISIEAGITAGWEKFTGLHGLNIGINHFGASAPGKDVASHFGFVKDKIKSKIESYLNE